MVLSASVKVGATTTWMGMAGSWAYRLTRVSMGWIVMCRVGVALALLSGPLSRQAWVLSVA